MSLPNIPHAIISYNQWNRVVIQIDDGYVFVNMANYDDLTDNDGNPREPYPEELSYFRYGVFAPQTDFERFVVVEEDSVSQEQIF